jgi:hypothetical protein
MHKCSVTFAVFLCLLVILPLVSSTQVTEPKKYFPLPEQNATVILLNGTSYDASGVYYGAGNYSEGRIYSWYFTMFSTGNGTTDLQISAHNCNVTITSYNYLRNAVGGDWFNETSWLNYTITGTGTQSLAYFGRTSTVYIDGALKQQGDGWNSTGLGLTVTGATSQVSIYSQYTSFEPPRNPPHLYFPIDYIFIIAVVVVIVALTVFLLILNRHMQVTNNKRDVNNLL